MSSSTSNELIISDVDRIIGDAVYEILRTGLVDHISNKMLLQHLTRKYLYIYETCSSVEESLLYEEALELLISITGE